MQVTITTLEMLTPPAAAPRAVPADVRIDRATDVSPEFARYLYGLVGGAWHWTDQLAWSREQWAEDLAVPGTEFLVLVGDGQPLGYVQLQPQPRGADAQVEVRYFGLAEGAIGRGLGGLLLEHGVAAAWTMGERFDLPAVTRVWVHTCSLDGPAALANYQSRGFVVSGVETEEQVVADAPLGSWRSLGGPVAGRPESRHLSEIVHASPRAVWRFASDPVNLPRWAAGLAQAPVRRRGEQLVVDSPKGEVTVEFVGANDLGVLDHVVTLPSGEAVLNPLRVLEHPAGAELVFTVRQRDMTVDEFDRDCAAVAADLARLRAHVESAAASGDDSPIGATTH
ncbi:GNAT family N-acetyltransferase [Gulosibacter sediminis]|uniref:GNAT family N-acetyltransferase n=1 Tax=Gulosibacter sediminis TaxID=1729695 RepID=UPI0024A7B52A|nr:GNAT family N-acetyltransferase [Gulosibacter sediminis]